MKQLIQRQGNSTLKPKQIAAIVKMAMQGNDAKSIQREIIAAYPSFATDVEAQKRALAALQKREGGVTVCANLLTDHIMKKIKTQPPPVQ